MLATDSGEMAEDAVWSESLSAANSLIFRENTGNLGIQLPNEEQITVKGGRNAR